MEPETNDLGPLNAEDLRQTALLYAGLGADDKLPPDIRFLTNVAKLIAKRNVLDNEASDPHSLAVFLLAPSTTEELKKIAHRVPILNNGATTLNGHIWLVAEVVNSGLKLEDQIPDDDDELFKFVVDSLGLGEVPAVIFDPRDLTPMIRFYSSGLLNPNECETYPAIGNEVTNDKIFDVIERIYKQCLVTPDSHSVAVKLWKRPDRCWPSSNAESVVQAILRSGLAAQFGTCDIREEQPTTVGRTDLEIEEKVLDQPGIVIRHALIELKILRSFGETGDSVSETKTLEWVDSGLEQAFAYRNDKGFKNAALCCFDMRSQDDKDACFNQVRDKASTLQVVLGRWYIYSSSKRYRKELAG